MTKHVLIVCKACNTQADQGSPDQESDGIHLLSQLEELHQQWPRQGELAIETTTCLCICERPCAIAYVGTNKPTYLFADLADENCAADLLIAAELYLDSEDGRVPAYKLPKALQPHRAARIPPAPSG